MKDEGWTPDLVAEIMSDALRWAHFCAGVVGPGSVRGSMPSYQPTLADHLLEGWGVPETAGDLDDDRPPPPMVTAERAQFYEDALSWPARYVAGTNPGSARMLSLWLRHRRGKRAPGFNRAVEALGLSRQNAQGLRDRALRLIAVGLTKDGVPTNVE